MGCELCGRSTCIRSFHSIEEQEDHDKTKDDVMNERDALRARIEDVEGMAKVIFESEMDKTIEWGDNLGDWLRKNYLRHARAVSAWLKGG